MCIRKKKQDAKPKSDTTNSQKQLVSGNAKMSTEKSVKGQVSDDANNKNVTQTTQTSHATSSPNNHSQKKLAPRSNENPAPVIPSKRPNSLGDAKETREGGSTDNAAAPGGVARTLDNVPTIDNNTPDRSRGRKGGETPTRSKDPGGLTNENAHGEEKFENGEEAPNKPRSQDTENSLRSVQRNMPEYDADKDSKKADVVGKESRKSKKIGTKKRSVKDNNKKS